MSTSVSTMEIKPDKRTPNRRIAKTAHLTIRVIVFVIISVLCGIVLVEKGPDYESYAPYFNQVRISDFDYVFSHRIEPVFGALTFFLNKIFPSDISVFLCFIVISITLKSYIISKFRKTGIIYTVLVAFYLIRFFPLHELTQIRISLAIGFVMMSFYLHNTKVLKWIFFLLASQTHYSTIILLPLIFLVDTVQEGKNKYADNEKLIWASIFITATLLGLASKILIEYISPYYLVLQIYDNTGFGEQAASPFNAMIILDIVGLVTGLAIQRKMSESTRSWLYIQTLGIIIFYSMIKFPLMAFRVKELFSLFWIFYIKDALEYKGLVKYHALFFALICVVSYIYFYFIGKSAIFHVF